jgi:hypothetical protein
LLGLKHPARDTFFGDKVSPGLRSYMVLDAREVFPNGGGIVRMLP